MRLKKLLAVCLVAAAIVPTPSSAADLQPVGSWNLDYGDTACTAARQFGNPSEPIVFAIVPSITGANYELVINTPKGGPKYAEELNGSVSLGDKSVSTLVIHYGDRTTHKGVYKYQLSAADMERGRNSTRISLNQGALSHFGLALTDMPAVLDGLKACTADLQNYWNMGPSRASRFSRSAKADDIRRLFTGDDYPSEAVTKTQQGTAQYILMIDEKGAVAGCDLVRRSGVPVLDAMGCAVIQERGKFTPALDAQGKPTRDTVTSPPITWRMM